MYSVLKIKYSFITSLLAMSIPQNCFDDNAYTSKLYFRGFILEGVYFEG